MFLDDISDLDEFHQGRCVRSVFDLDFPLWFYALVILAGLSVIPWFHLIGCIIFKIISKAAASLNLNWLHGYRSANKKMMADKTTIDLNSTLDTNTTSKTDIKRIIKQQWETDYTESTSVDISYSNGPTSPKTANLIKQRSPVHLDPCI